MHIYHPGNAIAISFTLPHTPYPECCAQPRVSNHQLSDALLPDDSPDPEAGVVELSDFVLSPAGTESSTSKSNTNSFVSSVPLRLPTAHTSFVFEHRSLQTTPPEPPESSRTRSRTNSPVRTDHSFTVPSSDEVTAKRRLNCKQVTALWCL
jgi:hypothetical protein